MTPLPRPLHHAAAHRGRGACVAWLLAIVLLFQLLVQTQHDHAHASKTHHCVACALHAQPLAGPPAASLAVAPAPVLVSGLALASHVHAQPGRAVAYFLPPSHAPPPFLPLH